MMVVRRGGLSVALRQREERRQADAVATAMRIDSAVLVALALASRCTGAAGGGSSVVDCVGGGDDCDVGGEGGLSVALRQREELRQADEVTKWRPRCVSIRPCWWHWPLVAQAGCSWRWLFCI
jgi:hypothetical protein